MLWSNERGYEKRNWTFKQLRILFLKFLLHFHQKNDPIEHQVSETETQLNASITYSMLFCMLDLSNQNRGILIVRADYRLHMFLKWGQYK